MRVAPPATRAEVPWLPPHNYDCSEGHYVQAEHPVDRCPACHLGEPCAGQLHPVGKGSRTKEPA